MDARISRRDVERIVADAAACETEICGLLLGEGARVDAVLPCANVAAEPRRRFEIDPSALIAAHRAARGGGGAVIGCYHSHPGGSAEPSATDAAMAAPDGMLWLIVAGTAITGWRAVARGAQHGRFDPVPITVMTSP